jgi:Ca2+-binding EF-hand superfamily protein
MHSGEMAIQRLHMKNVYKRGRDRVMDEGEFVKTMQDAIGFYEVQAEERVLSRLFSEVDGNRDGWISYQEYFEFLRYYFGSQSEAKRVKSDYRVGRTERRSENYVQIKQERYEDRSNSRRYEVPKIRETTFMR